MSEFQPRLLENGRVCCSASYALCDACRVHHGISENAYLANQERHLGTLRIAQPVAPSYTPPDSYASAAEALRAASETPLDRFERTYKAQRLADLTAEHDRHAMAIRVTPTPRLSAAELDTLKAPDGYALALQKENNR